MRRALVLVLAVAGCGTTGGGGGNARTDGSADKALAAYAAGDLAQAEAEAKAALARDKNDVIALRLLGRIELFTNRLKPSAEHLTRVIEIITADPKAPSDFAAYQDLVWALYRLDDFVRAAHTVRLLQDQVLWQKFQQLGQLVAYLARWDSEPAILAFQTADPLPTVRLRVNGQAGTFVVDTGAGELVLDKAFANKVRAHAVGIRTEQISGRLEEAWVDEVVAGPLTVRNVPVQVRHLQPLGRATVDGAIGANFLLHFAFSIDYRRGRLVLYRPSTPVTRAGKEMPFVVAGDRYLLARGTVDGRATFLHINSGMPKVPVAPSMPGLALDAKVAEVTLGPLSFKNPEQDYRLFVSGLDANFGLPIGAALGHEAFKSRVLTFEPDRMTLTIE